MPVVLVHGALRGRPGLLPTAAYLRRRGFEPRVFGYRTRADGIDGAARRLERALAGWMPGGAPAIGFVTHSMGGLVVRQYLAESPAPAAQVRVVMLAPPNQGSAVAEAWAGRGAFHALYGAAAEELRPARVQRRPALPPGTDLLVLAGGRRDGGPGFNRLVPGNDDGLVGVEETRLGEVEPLLVGGTHTFLQWRLDVLERAATFLRAGDLHETSRA